MRKHLMFVALVLVAPLLFGAAEILETTGGGKAAVVWAPAGGPVDQPASPDAREGNSVQGLTVHEWGTFTSVAGPDGNAIEWLPAGGPTDLPCFVSLLGTGAKVFSPAERGGRANRTLVRMETPVLYFYSPREETVNVRVSFPRGLVTEWFPEATLGPANVSNTIKAFPNVTSTIEWPNVKVLPGATVSYRMDETQSHYYAARRTGAAPLQVGKEYEKFLFYRGIASFQPPLTARVTREGRIEVANLGQDVVPSIVLFENRGGKIGYRIHNALSGRAVTLELPPLTQTFESLQRDLEAMLRAQGMYPLEARAMVDTWRDSWFEQGTRIFYIVPPRTVDSILPLEVSPKPIAVARAFVGRMEVITPATLNEVLSAVEKNDRKGLEVYGRFLEPILHDFMKEYRADGQIASIRAAYVEAASACSKNRW